MMQRFLFISSLFLLQTFAVFSQNLILAKKLGGPQADKITDLATDAQSNVYFCGSFQGTAEMDPGPGTQNRTSAGQDDIWVGKFNATGEYQWGISIGGTQNDKAAQIAVDAFGNTWVSGLFFGSVDFDPGAGTAIRTADGSATDVFLVKFNAQGEFQWVQTFGNTNAETYTTLSTDANGNALFSFTFTGTVDLDPGMLVQSATSTPNRDGTAVVRLNPGGNLVWGKFVPLGRMFSSTTDAAGNLYLAGVSGSGADMNPGSGVSAVPGNYQGDVAVLTKWTSAGVFSFLKSIGAEGFPASAIFNDVKLDGSGNIVLAGLFTGKMDLNPGSAAGDTAWYQSKDPNQGQSDAFLLKLNGTGAYQWGYAMGSPGSDFGTSVTADPSGNVWFAGFGSGSVDVDPSLAFSYPINATNRSFLVKYSGSGSFQMADLLGTNSGPMGIGLPSSPILVPDATGKIWLAGDFSGTLDAAPGSASSPLVSSGGFDAFIAQLNPCSPAAIQIQPQPQAVCPGTSAQLSVIPTGNGPFVYQWRKGNQVVGNAANLVLPNASQATTGQYQVAVYSTCGLVLSNPVAVSLKTNTTLSTSPVAQAVCSGVNVSFSCQAAGTGPFTYTWKQGNTVVGTNAATLSLTGVTPAQAGSYVVQVAGSCNTVTSTPVALTVQAVNPTVLISGNSLTSSIQGASYQWRNCNGNTNIAGQTNPTFTPAVSGLYSIRVTSAQGCSGISQCVAFTVTDVLNPTEKDEVKVCPNPFVGEIELITPEPAMYRLLDLQGRCLLSGFGQANFRISTGSVPPGLYILQVGNRSFRMVK